MKLNNMMETLSQGQNRYSLKVKNCHTLLDVEHFTGREAISDTYRYQVTFTSPSQDLLPQQFLRRNTALTFTLPQNTIFGLTTPSVITKRVHGVVTAFKRISGSVDEARYQLVIEPFFALLRHEMRSHRFFINQSVPEVIEQILREHHFEGWEFEFNLSKEYPRREQINQINENDRQFIERLLSEVGIYYHFQLQSETQTEVIHFSDSQQGYLFEKTLPLNSPSGMNDNHTESVWGLTLRQHIVENSVLTKDYNHRQSQDPLTSVVTDITRGDGEEYNYGDVYHYRARHLTRGEKRDPEPETANYWARLDHERFLARQTQLQGESNAVNLSPLLVLTIKEEQLPPTLPSLFIHPILLTRLRFNASRDKALQVKFTAVPYSETLCWRPVLKPRPVIAGTLTARVTSIKDNDTYANLNEHGLYWVKFDADLDAKKKGYESMPVRLAKPYAGDTYGIHFPLIEGTEVAIAFHEGDPDRPYIAHALHDSHHPDHITNRNPTRNIIRTPANNKLRMEDKRGQEHIKISTEYGGKTQLNLGHLVDRQRQQRGDGFELRTDSWGAIRAAKGLLLTTQEQAKAGHQQLSINEIKRQLSEALSIAESLSGLLEVAQIPPLDHTEQTQFLEHSIEEFNEPVIVAGAPGGVAVSTPNHIQLSSNKNQFYTAGGNTEISSLKRLVLLAKKKVVLFSHELGMKLVSAAGKIEMQAQTGAIDIIAQKGVQITSTEDEIIISSKKKITLQCGGSYITLDEGKIEQGSGGEFKVKSNQIQFSGSATLDSPFPKFTACESMASEAAKKGSGLLSLS